MKRTPVQIGDRVFASRGTAKGRRHVAVGWVHEIIEGIPPARNFLIGGRPSTKRTPKVIGWYSRAKRISDKRLQHYCRIFDRMNGKQSKFDQIWQHLIELKKSRSSSH